MIGSHLCSAGAVVPTPATPGVTADTRFEFKVGGKEVFVGKEVSDGMRLSIAYFDVEGTVQVEATASEDFNDHKVMPSRHGIQATKRDRTLHFSITDDDCICPHALNAAGNGEPVGNHFLFEDCVLWQTGSGNCIRIGASFETSQVLNWTFRRIDCIAHTGAAIIVDHSHWATVKNLRFIEFHDDSLTAYGGDEHTATVPAGFSNFKAAIYEPGIEGEYDVYLHWGDHIGKAANARWIVLHAGGYQTRYLDQNASPGWHHHGRYTMDASSYVRLALPGYFSIANGPMVADAVKFERATDDPPPSQP